MEPTATNSSEDMEKRDLKLKLREEVLELREELLDLREKGLIPLREEVSTLRSRFFQVSVGIALIMIVSGLFGITKWSQLDSKMDDLVERRVNSKVDGEVRKRTEESLRFGEKLQYALYLAQAENPRVQRVLTMLRRLAEKRSQNELLFSYLMECYIRFDECDEGYRQLKTLEKKGMKSEDLEMPGSLRNYGFILWVRSLSNGMDEAEVYKAATFLEDSLTRAWQERDEEGIRASAEYLVLLYLSREQDANARECAAGYLSNSTPDWEKYMDKKWFKKLEKRRPDIRTTLTKVVAKSVGDTEGS